MNTHDELTRPKICRGCGCTFYRPTAGKRMLSPNKWRARMFCSTPCARTHAGLTRGDPTGWSTCHRIARKHIKAACEICGKTPEQKHRLHVHHRDDNWMNNRPDNLQTICQPCHAAQHAADRPRCSHCTRPATAGPLCANHERRRLKYGDPTHYARKKRIITEERPCPKPIEHPSPSPRSPSNDTPPTCYSNGWELFPLAATTQQGIGIPDTARKRW